MTGSFTSRDRGPTRPLLMRRTSGRSDTVLDVGAGAGRYSLPVASMVRRLTAIEPSAGMRASFAEELERRGITNVDIVADSWEDARVEQHDVAMVANVLYFVR